MAASAALVSRDIDNSGPSSGRLWRTLYTIKLLWAAADTYPSGGIAMPALSAIGIQQAITRGGLTDHVVYDDAGAGLLARHDLSANTIRLYKWVQTVAGTCFTLKELGTGVAFNNAANGLGARTDAGQAALSIPGISNANVSVSVEGLLG